MRVVLNLVGLLVVLAVLALVGRHLMTRTVGVAPVGGAGQAVPLQAATERVKAELDEAMRQAAARASEADR